MREVIRYQADDGRVFESEIDCINHDETISKIDSIMSTLKPVPKDSDFSNGGGFVQQDIDTVSIAMTRIVELSNIETSKEFNANPFAYRHGNVGRMLSDNESSSLLYSAWYRFMCMDDTGREWGQPYFATYPHKGTQKNLTPSGI